METNIAKSSGSHNTHARFSPSSSHQWVHCTASLPFIEANNHRIKKDDSSTWSNEGTVAHDYAANLLIGKITEADIPESIREYILGYRDHCLASIPENGKYQVEVSIPLFYQRNEKGTCDFLYSDFRRTVLRDYKHGIGIFVPAFQNTQLAIYAMSYLDHMEDEDELLEFPEDMPVSLGIHQPRHREGHLLVPWELTLKELREFCVHIREAYEAGSSALRAVTNTLPCGTRDVAPEEILEVAPWVVFHPQEGDDGACRWCKAKAFCPERRKAALSELSIPAHDVTGEAMIAMMPDLTKEEKKLPALERIETRLSKAGIPGSVVTDDYLVAICRARDAIEGMLSDAWEYLESRALGGEEIPGVKIVQGRQGNRVWQDDESAEKFLRGQGLGKDERTTAKVIGPAAAEKLLKEKLTNPRTLRRFEQLVTRSEGQRKLALESDKREALGNVMPLLD